MRVLLIKTSSLGDVFHTFPALEELRRNRPDVIIDWVVEEGFADMARWHPLVERVIPVAIRRWRKRFWSPATWREVRQARALVNEQRYDLVLDAQGLIKSAWLSRWAKAPRYGLDKHSAREPLASRAYTHPISVAKGQHAVLRLRQLFAQVFGYAVAAGEMPAGISRERWPQPELAGPYVVFLHATTWPTKHWPESYWRQLCEIAGQHQLKVYLPWGNATEKERAERLADQLGHVSVLPRMGLSELAGILAWAQGIVGVDTGLSHVAAAFGLPQVAIYGSTDPTLTGVTGPGVTLLHSQRECSPCLERECRYRHENHPVQPPCYLDISPAQVWASLKLENAPA